ncbi:TadE/TadG family type IV pilus assembly protein [Neorhizobium sp. NCHU2750]|uniref:pilus assembly protein TadG-related protein n=1 Tax=Neorhizobium sp. NCHU2750 TaxID=1825976 RepID=UPI001FDEE4FF
MMTALILPVLLGGAGLAIDVTNLMLSKRQLQEATDAAALAVSGAMANGADTATAQTLGKDFVAGQLANYVDSTQIAAVKNATVVSINSATDAATGAKTYAVAVTSNANIALTPLTGLFAGQSVAVSAASNTLSGAGAGAGSGTAAASNGISMDILLDESGSMAENTTTVKGTTCILNLLGICIGQQTTYVTKIEALKKAAATLFDALDKSDPNTRYVRTGTISYTNGIKGQSAMAWGTTASRTYVTSMTMNPTGGTDATSSVTTATTNIQKNQYGTDPESVAQAKKNNKTSDRIMVLMTDGEMTGNGTTWSQKLDLSVRNGCDAAKASGIRIYTIAFMAPDRGKALLQYCASTAANYYQPDTMDALVASFKAVADNTIKPVNRLTN